MDVTLLFFLPLIGGFLFVQWFFATRYRAARQETQRLYYQAAVCGILLSILGLAVHRWAAGLPAYRVLADDIGRTFIGPLLERPAPAGSAASTAVRIEVAFACAWALVLGLLTPVVNVIVTLIDRACVRWLRRPSLIQAINHASITDQFERLLADALRDSTQIQITLSNQKVYVGWVTRSPNPLGQEKYFRIQPSISGYRSKDDGAVTFTTFYDDILERYKKDPERLRSYEIVIPMDKIVSASGFDLAAYVEFQKKQRAAAAIAAAAAPMTTPETRIAGDVTVYLGRPLRRS